MLAMSSPAMIRLRLRCSLSVSFPHTKVWKTILKSIGRVSTRLVSVTERPR